MPRDETRARTNQLLHALSLEHGRRTFAAACSHGMRKKTAFAMALLPNPEVLFLDEPFEAIDPVTAKIMRDLLQSVSRHGVTVFLTSHILSMVERIAHQIVMIRKGSESLGFACRRAAAVARRSLFRSGRDARRRGIGMARAIAILKALALAYRRDWTALQSLAGNNFFLITAFLLRQAGTFVYLDHGPGRAVPFEHGPVAQNPARRAWRSGR